MSTTELDKEDEVMMEQYPEDILGGKVLFLSKSIALEESETAHFLRLSDNVHMRDILQVMSEKWQLNQPPLKLCVSVIGTNSIFSLGRSQRKWFSDNILALTAKPETLLMTAGFNIGVGKLIGDTLRYRKAQYPNEEVRCLGVTPWTFGHNRGKFEDEIAKDKVQDLQDESRLIIRESEGISLNRYHSHFLLIDNGISQSSGAHQSAEYRARLESMMARPTTDAYIKGFGVRVVILVVGGGYDVIVHCLHSTKYGIPLIICKGSGGAADVLAFACETPVRNNDVKRKLNELLYKVHDGEKQNENETMAMIDEITTFSLIQVIKMTTEGEFALPNVVWDKLSLQDDTPLEKMKKALKANRLDIARVLATTKKDHRNDLFMCALLENKSEFLEVFLENEFPIYSFLSIQRLTALYNNEKDAAHFRRLLKQVCGFEGGEIGLSDVEELLRKMTWDLYHNEEYEQDQKERILISSFDEEMDALDPPCVVYDFSCRGRIKKPAQIQARSRNSMSAFKDLFICSVLLCRREMVDFMWKRCGDKIFMALVACRLFEQIRESVPPLETEMRDMLWSFQQKYEKRAYKQMNMFKTEQLSEAMKLVQSPHTLLPINSIDLAAKANCKKFVTSFACQKYIENRWQGDFQAHPLVHFMGVLFPLLLCVPGCITVVPREGKNQLSGFFLLRAFYTTPICNFFRHGLAFLFFLVFYSYFVLLKVWPERISIQEYVVFAYIGCFTMRELREIMENRESNVGQRVFYRSSYWNTLDIIIIIIGIATALLRIGLTQTYALAMSLYCSLTILLFIRLTQLYWAHRKLGPKLLMFRGMLKELGYFLFILAIPVMSYGVVSRALLYPHAHYTYQIEREFWYFSFFQIFALYDRNYAIAVKDGCHGNVSAQLDGIYCPHYNFLVPLLLAIYFLIVLVMMFNLLIATFNTVYEKKQKLSREYWKFYFYFLVEEYQSKPMLVMPFSALEDIFYILKFLFCSCNKKPPQAKQSHRIEMDQQEEMQKLTSA